MEDDDGLADELRDVVSSLTSSNLCPSISKELEVSLAQTFGRTGKNIESMPPPIPVISSSISEMEMTTTTKRRSALTRPPAPPPHHHNHHLSLIASQQQESAIIKLLRERLEEKERIERDLLERLRVSQENMHLDHDRANQARLDTERLQRQLTDATFENKRVYNEFNELQEANRRQVKTVQRLEAELSHKKSVMADSIKLEKRAREAEESNGDFRKQLAVTRGQLEVCKRDLEAANKERREYEVEFAKERVKAQRDLKEMRTKLSVRS